MTEKPNSSRKLPWPLLVPAALSIAFAATSGSSSQQTVTTALATAPQLGAALLQSAKDGTAGFELADGHWQLPDSCWSFSQSRSSGEAPQSAPALETSQIDQPVELDKHLLLLVRNLMTLQSVQDGRTVYRLRSAEMSGEAVTLQHGGVEIPIFIQVSWPAFNDLWTTVTAQRADAQHGRVQLLQLPDGIQATATRVSPSGIPQCQLLSSKFTVPQFRSLFAAEGWEVERPPFLEDANEVFWIVRDQHHLEVRVRSVPGISGTTALIRSI